VDYRELTDAKRAGVVTIEYQFKADNETDVSVIRLLNHLVWCTISIGYNIAICLDNCLSLYIFVVFAYVNIRVGTHYP